MADTRHDCPGQCGRRVTRPMLACRLCWGDLPSDLATVLTRADNIRRRHPTDPAAIASHRRAVIAALDWYRATTKEPAP